MDSQQPDKGTLTLVGLLTDRKLQSEAVADPVDPVRLALTGCAGDYGVGYRIYRRLKPASFELAMSPLRQAWRLGGLHRASPVPFRGSCFTTGLHPPAATPQRRIACLYKRWSYQVSACFAHSICALRDALSAPVLSTGARKRKSAARGGPNHCGRSYRRTQRSGPRRADPLAPARAKLPASCIFLAHRFTMAVTYQPEAICIHPVL